MLFLFSNIARWLEEIIAGSWIHFLRTFSEEPVSATISGPYVVSRSVLALFPKNLLHTAQNWS